VLDASPLCYALSFCSWVRFHVCWLDLGMLIKLRACFGVYGDSEFALEIRLRFTCELPSFLLAAVIVVFFLDDATRSYRVTTLFEHNYFQKRKVVPNIKATCPKLIRVKSVAPSTQYKCPTNILTEYFFNWPSTIF
jgi:hypothetical protein